MPMKIIAALSAVFLIYYFYGKIKASLSGEFLGNKLDEKPFEKQKVCKRKALLFTILCASLEVFIISEYFLTFLVFEHIIAAVALVGILLSFGGILAMNRKYKK